MLKQKKKDPDQAALRVVCSRSALFAITADQMLSKQQLTQVLTINTHCLPYTPLLSFWQLLNRGLRLVKTFIKRYYMYFLHFSFSFCFMHKVIKLFKHIRTVLNSHDILDEFISQLRDVWFSQLLLMTAL